MVYVETGENDTIKNLKCGEKNENNIIKSVNSPILAGFVKDSAWIYEKEIRLRIDLDKSVEDGVTRVAVKIPDDIFSEMIITTGPRFSPKYDLNNIKKDHEVKKSIYSGKLKYIYCDKCAYKKK